MNKEMLFFRNTKTPHEDIKRNFSGYVGSWFKTIEECNEYRIRNHMEDWLPTKYDESSQLYCANPELGLSGYKIETTIDIYNFLTLMGDDNNHFFLSQNYDLNSGADGEDCFRDAVYLKPYEQYKMFAIYSEFLNIEKQEKLITDTILKVLEKTDINPIEINNGECMNFASDVCKKIGDINEVLIVKTGNFFTEDELLDRDLLEKHWKGTVLPPGITYDMLDTIFSDNHVWITYNGKHYDCDAPNGVNSIFDLPIYRRMIYGEFFEKIDNQYKNSPWWIESKKHYDDITNYFNSLKI